MTENKLIQIIAKLVQMIAKGKGTAFVLEESDGTALPVDSDMPGLYTITVSGGGAQDIDFYLPVDDTDVSEQIAIKCVLDSAVVINSIDFQTYALGIWITDDAYAAGPIAADGSSHQHWTSMFPLRDLRGKGTKHRIHMNVAGDCTGACSAMGMVL